MPQSSVQGSVTLRKLRTGATATISLSSTMQLFQLYTTDAQGAVQVAPSWAGAAGTYPVVTVNAVSSQGAITVSSVLWKINTTNATTIDGVSEVVTGGVHSLHINADLADLLNYNSGTLTAEITITDESGATQTVTKSETIRIQKAVSDGYNLMINCNKAYVDGSTSTTNPTTLTAVCYLGVTPVLSGVTYYWLKSATEAVVQGTTPSGDSYSITDPDEVNGSQLYVCRAYNGSGAEVDAEGILIVDNSDPYYLVASAQQSKGGSSLGIAGQDNVTSVNVASEHDSTEVTFKVQSSAGVDYGSVSAWSVEKRHADTMKLIKEVSGAGYTADPTAAEIASGADADSYNTATASNAATVSISVLDADYVSSSGGSNHDTEVIVTATATL